MSSVSLNMLWTSEPIKRGALIRYQSRTELNYILIMCHSSIANSKHVRINPASWCSVFPPFINIHCSMQYTFCSNSVSSSIISCCMSAILTFGAHVADPTHIRMITRFVKSISHDRIALFRFQWCCHYCKLSYTSSNPHGINIFVAQ